MNRYRVSFIVLILMIVSLLGCAVAPQQTEQEQQGTQRPAPTETGSLQREWHDVAYATESEAQKLDIYLPATGDGPFPVIVSIHGGAFLGGDKIAAAPEMDGVNRGYAVVRVNYRLYLEATFPAAVYDVKAAVRFLKAHAEEYNLDANRIAAWGDSAGGYMVNMLGVSSGVAELEDLTMGNPDQSSSVKAVIDYYGPSNFVTIKAEHIANGDTIDEDFDTTSSEARFLGGDLNAISETVVLASPVTHVSSEAPPFFIAHGTDDNLVPLQQSVQFAEALKAAIGEDNVTLVVIEGAGHGTEEFKTDEMLDAAFSFLDKYLK